MAMAEPDRVTERYARRGTDPAL
ncbi:MAG: hypothetical protein RL260_3930, partial [Pseudomonadota bacterium]